MYIPASKQLFLILPLLLWGCIAMAQSRELEKLVSLIDEEAYQEAISTGEAIDTNTIALASKARLQWLLSTAYRYSNLQDKQLRYLQLAKNNYQKLDSTNKADEIDLEILYVVASNKTNYGEVLKLTDTFLNYAKKKNDHDFLCNTYRYIGRIVYFYDVNYALQIFKLALKENEYGNNALIRGKIYCNMGTCYADDRIKQPDSALYVYDKAMNIYKKLNEQYEMALLHINIGVAYHKKKEYQRALKEFGIADTLNFKKFRRVVKSFVPHYSILTYKAMGDYKSALECFEKEKAYIDSLDIQDQLKTIKDLETKYKTVEKEIENQRLAGEGERKNMILIAIGSILLLLLAVGLLLLNRASKKRKIAEQERAIESQKLQTLLKEQELHEIEVMLKSQELERKRIAGDLHDNLGSMLTTIKHNFRRLENEQNQEASKKLYKKTEAVINETYSQIRHISHLKNLGVAANEGLLPAIKTMAEKMTVINHIRFNVIPFGLSNRLKSNLEVALFRMIQELCTNIIKHSKATEVNIYLTEHEDGQLNIMIEDNGRGFVLSELRKFNTGIGLKNIEKKVEQLGGTFTIDTSPGYGTSVIIDVPVD